MSKYLLNILLILLLAFQVQPAMSRTQYYQYNGNIPFIEMMLNMMSVMGIIDKIPAQFMSNRYGGYGAYNNLYNGQNPYTNLLLKKALLNQRGLNSTGLNFLGYNPLTMGGLGMNPLTLNPGLNSSGPYAQNLYPGLYPGLNNTGLYNRWGQYNTGLSALSSSPWSGSSWSGSPWDKALLGGFSSGSFSRSPFINNNIFNISPSRFAGASRSPRYNYARPYNRHFYRNGYNSRDNYGWRKQARRRHAWENEGGSGNKWSGGNSSADSPCVTEFCGLLSPGLPAGIQPDRQFGRQMLFLNGLWITDSGEMLGIKNNRFLWSDGHSRYLTGTIRALPGTLVANVDGEGNRVMQYQYRLENNRLVTEDQNGLMRVFNRVPVN